MSIKRVGFAALLSFVALNTWAGGGGAAANANAKASYDVTGKWTAKIEGRGPPQTLVFDLKQDGEKVTGTISTNGGPAQEISDGKAGRSALRFSVKTSMPPMQMPGQPANPNAKPMEMVTKYTAKISGDDMELEREMQMPAMGGGMPMGGGMGGGGMGGGMPPGGGMGGGGMGGGMPPGGGMGGGMPMGGGMGGKPPPIKAHRE